MSDSFSVRPCATSGVSRIFCSSSKAPSRRMDTCGPRVSTEPDGVNAFWLLSAAKTSCGERPRVARRSCENCTSMRSDCSPTMLTFLTPGTCSSRCRSVSASRTSRRGSSPLAFSAYSAKVTSEYSSLMKGPITPGGRLRASSPIFLRAW